MSETIIIASAARTPVGSFNGAFAETPAHILGSIAIKAALERAGVEASAVDEVIMGQILTAGTGQNPARQAAMAAGIPAEATAWGLNQLCGSGLRAVAIGMQQIAMGDATIIVACRWLPREDRNRKAGLGPTPLLLPVCLPPSLPDAPDFGRCLPLKFGP